MVIKKLFSGPAPEDKAARRLYEQAVGCARAEKFYREHEVPDSLDGRFEMISLHVYLLLRRLKSEQGGQARAVSQALYDLMFADMDRSLREMGVGDLGVGKRVKTMAQALSGRIQVYDEGLEQGDDVLKAALRRNLYGTLEEVSDASLSRLAAYIRKQDAALQKQSPESAVSGDLHFDPEA